MLTYPMRVDAQARIHSIFAQEMARQPAGLRARPCKIVDGSARTGRGVEGAFRWLLSCMRSERATMPSQLLEPRQWGAHDGEGAEEVLGEEERVLLRPPRHACQESGVCDLVERFAVNAAHW